MEFLSVTFAFEQTIQIDRIRFKNNNLKTYACLKHTLF